MVHDPQVENHRSGFIKKIWMENLKKECFFLKIGVLKMFQRKPL